MAETISQDNPVYLPIRKWGDDPNIYDFSAKGGIVFDRNISYSAYPISGLN